MDRTFLAATVVFVALGVAGVVIALLPTGVGADGDELRALGPALAGAGLAAFLVEAFSWDRRRVRR